VDKAFWRMPLAQHHPYLLGERCIPPAVLSSERFMNRVRSDERANAIFPHFDQDGLCGYEIKNRGYTGFSSGGTKGLWFSHTEAFDTHLVLAESTIDALSYAALFPSPGSCYASTGGKMNPHQPALVTAAAKRMGVGATIIAATDNGLVLCPVLSFPRARGTDYRFSIGLYIGLRTKLHVKRVG
jgi:hypothetical protein